MEFEENLRNSITVIINQRNFIKMSLLLNHLLNHSSYVIYQNLKKICGKNYLKENTVRFWIAKFRKGETSTEEARESDRMIKI